MARRGEPLKAILGPLEQDVMDAVWQLGPATVRDVHEQLARSRKIAYTTVMTTMSRLAAKGLLAKDSSGLAHVYSARVSRENFARDTIQSVMAWLLDRYPQSAVSYLAEVVDDVDDVTLESLRDAVARRRAEEA
ncbi:MAG: BlaI/MecI/CopY family transcriptional regulator [Nitriliruptorales bacterium]|nr:BlaI/MecI/CopY family transcriptional regulator [Nitriliruptorales bacterium]